LFDFFGSSITEEFFEFDLFQQLKALKIMKHKQEAEEEYMEEKNLKLHQ